MSSNFPPSGGPDILDSSGGTPEQPAARNNRRAAYAAAGIIGTVVLAGGAAWAASWYLSSGADAAEMLPDSTLAFAQINLDPSGEQKIEALKTLNKFPGLKDEMDLSSSSDLRKSLFEQIQKDGTCADLDYDVDIKPWLGNRMALAAVDVGETDPAPVGVVEITDEAAAKEGIEKLVACGDDSDAGGYAVEGDWVVIAATDTIAEGVVSDASKSNLADDSSYQRWMDEAGGDSIVSAYLAPSAGVKLAEVLPEVLGASGVGSGQGLSDKQLAELKDFEGAALKVRFADGAVELESAGDASNNPLSDAIAGGSGTSVMGTLPDDTALAVGASFGKGWLQAYLDQIGETLGSSADLDSAIAQIESVTGLAIPADIEALTGDSFAIAMSSDIDVDALANAGDPTGLGIGLKVKGDPAAADATLDKLRAQLPDESWLASASSGDYLSVSPNQTWLEAISGDGGLGDSEAYTSVIPEGDKAIYAVYFNPDAGDDWLVKALKDSGAASDEIIANVDPLGPMGISVWLDGDVAHASLTLSTN